MTRSLRLPNMRRNLPLDGLTDAEYNFAYSIATQNRALKNQVPASEMLSMILDLVSRPRTPNEPYAKAVDEEAKREWFDLGDWMKFLHNQWYKPGWKVELRPGMGNALAMELTALVQVPVSDPVIAAVVDQRIGLKHIVHPEWARTEDEADRVLGAMIEDAEHKITQAWRRKS